MSDEVAPDRRVIAPADAADRGMRVMHRCRCDAPDPEADRIEPLEVPVDELREAGRVLVVCPECDYRLLVLAAPDAGE